MIALWLGTVALGAPGDGLNPVLANLYAEARSDEAAGRYREAANGYAVVVRGDPWFGAATLDLGRALVHDGRIDEALAVYATRPDDPDAVEQRARLTLDLGDLETARDLIDDLEALAPQRPGWRILEARRIGADRPTEGLDRLTEYLGFYGTSVDDRGFLEAWCQIRPALAGVDAVAAARRHLDAWLAASPDTGGAAELVDARRELAIDQAARALAASGADPLDSGQLGALARARAAFADHDYVTAAVALEALVAEVPRSAVAWATLSDVRAAQGDLAGSIEAIDAAIEIDPLDADAHVRRGARLLEGFGGRLDAAAVDAYRRAAERRPSDPAIWHAKAGAERRSGRWRQAVASYREVLRLDPDGVYADDARKAIADADRALPTPRDPLPGRGRPASVSEEAWTAYFRAWAWREHRPVPGRPDPISAEEAAARAWTSVRQARALAPDFVPAMNLEAAMLADRGQMAEAVALLEASLAHDQGQPETWLTLARVLDDQDEPGAEAAFDRAAELGHPTALWRRARALADAGRWWKARDALSAYFGATTHGPHYAEAVDLDAQLERRIRLLLGLGGLGSMLLLLVPLGARLWLRSGVGLDVLVDQAPREWPAIARILSALRHEVLKHHTSVLPTVAKALDNGDDEPAGWVADRLFGARGALERLDRYLNELQVIARAQETPLNVRYRDPVLGPLVEATRRLRRLEPELRRPTDREGLADTLRAIATTLHDEVYPALGQRIAALATLRLTGRVVSHIVADVCGEPAFRDAAVDVRVDWPDEGGRVRIAPGDLLDLLSNLVRNALAATATLPEPLPKGVAVVGRLETDDITGLEQLAIAVCDTHPQALTTAMVRGRYIARGLGIAADLATRAGGSITVEGPHGDYTKAVVVRLPAVEPPEFT
ncbi:MAG: tetratricopeptide repeat protein [Myxococcota bacterium]